MHLNLRFTKVARWGIPVMLPGIFLYASLTGEWLQPVHAAPQQAKQAARTLRTC
jgi:hypothetical protein